MRQALGLVVSRRRRLRRGRGLRRGGVHPIDPLSREALRDGAVLDLVLRIVKVDGKGDQVAGAVVGVALVSSFRVRFGEQVLLVRQAHRLYGEEYVAVADRVGLAHARDRLARRFLDAAHRSKELGRVALGGGLGQLRAFHAPFYNAQIALVRRMPPPGTVRPPAVRRCRCRLRGRLGTRVLAALDHEEITAFDLGHDTREGLVDETVERWIPHHVVRDVDLKPFVGRYWRGKSVQQVGKGWQGA